MSILLITHDLGVVAEMSDHVAVMYAGKIVEYTDTKTLYAEPRHPYTYGLFQSLPEMHESQDERLAEIPGAVPNPLDFPDGCKFHPRCFKASTLCGEHEPDLARSSGAEHDLACHYPVTAAEREERP